MSLLDRILHMHLTRENDQEDSRTSTVIYSSNINLYVFGTRSKANSLALLAEISICTVFLKVAIYQELKNLYDPCCF